jgi:hypothetical protein
VASCGRSFDSIDGRVDVRTIFEGWAIYICLFLRQERDTLWRFVEC